MKPTPLQELAGHLLGQPVADWIHERRSEGHTWRAIARDLSDATHGRIDVEHETVRSWHRSDQRAAS